MIKIEQEFKNRYGKVMPNVRNIHFEKREDLSRNVGKYITETTYGVDLLEDDNFTVENGIYLYQANYDNKKALRIYKDFANYKYTYHDDDDIVSSLQKRQKDIKLSEFPTGVVTIEDKIIGQEIPFYEGYNPITKAFLQNKISELPIYYYQKLLEIIKELYEHDIIYSDIHGRNFLISPDGKDLKIIDFEKKFLDFKKDSALYTYMLSNLKKLILELSTIKSFKLVDSFKKADSLENIENSVYESTKVLKK